MPQTRSSSSSSATSPSATRPGLPPVPVGIFLPPRPLRPAAQPQPATDAGLQQPADRDDWCGVPARDLARLIASYTQPGDLVTDVDDHPIVARAAGYLDRRYRRLHTGLHSAGRHEPAGSGCPGHRDARLRAALMLVRLPRVEVDGLDLHEMTRAMHAWRTLLRPGGYLLVALMPPGSPDGRGSHRATAITAARTAGLAWQQEFLVVTAPVAEYEPRAMPDSAAHAPTVLVDGRHQSAHVKLLAFHHRTGGDDA